MQGDAVAIHAVQLRVTHIKMVIGRFGAMAPV